MNNYRNQKYKKEIISNINITPFTDVILVLLIIFMISAPTIYLSSIQIQLPEGWGKQSIKQFEEIIGIDKNGTIYYRNRMISLEKLIQKLKGENQSKKIRILINADKDTKHGKVIEVIEKLRQNRFSEVYVGTAK